MRRAHARGMALLLTTLALTGVSTALAPAAFAAPPAGTLAITATPAAATEGDTVAVAVTGTGVTDLYAYDLVITFDPTLLAFDADSATGPDGGFLAATVDDGAVTVTHARLGTSPALAGDLTLAGLTFTALDGGTATLALPSAELVGSTLETTVFAPDLPPTATVELTALPAPVPVPSESAAPVPSASATATAAPVAAAGPTSPLAATGSDATPWLVSGAFGVVLLAVGAVLVARRRRAVTE